MRVFVVYVMPERDGWFTPLLPQSPIPSQLFPTAISSHNLLRFPVRPVESVRLWPLFTGPAVLLTVAWHGRAGGWVGSRLYLLALHVQLACEGRV